MARAAENEECEGIFVFKDIQTPKSYVVQVWSVGSIVVWVGRIL